MSQDPNRATPGHPESWIEAAEKVAQHSYSPYSKFRVGAAVVDQDGRVFSGTNVENSSYGLTICAERGAVLKAISEGATSLHGVAVWVDGEDVVSPCGACLQVLLEFSKDGEEFPVELGSSSGAKKTTNLAALLPAPFRLS